MLYCNLLCECYIQIVVTMYFIFHQGASTGDSGLRVRCPTESELRRSAAGAWRRCPAADKVFAAGDGAGHRSEQRRAFKSLRSRSIQKKAEALCLFQTMALEAEK